MKVESESFYFSEPQNTHIVFLCYVSLESFYLIKSSMLLLMLQFVLSDFCRVPCIRLGHEVKPGQRVIYMVDTESASNIQ